MKKGFKIGKKCRLKITVHFSIQGLYVCDMFISNFIYFESDIDSSQKVLELWLDSH